MELALLVYLINLLGPVKTMCTATVFFGGIVWCAWKIHSINMKAGGPSWQLSTTIILAIVLSIALPSERTAYLMVGAYTAQKVAESPQVQELSADVLKIITAKVKYYAEEADKSGKSTN
jgi:hypothetical protein